MLTRRAAAKVVAGDDDLRAHAVAPLALAVLGSVEHKVLDLDRDAVGSARLRDLDGVVVAQLGKGGEAEAGATDGLEVPARSKGQACVRG